MSHLPQKILDLSPVRRLIFEKKDSPASIVYFNLSQNKDYKKNTINYESIKSNYFLKHFKILVIEKYDKKKILQKYFIENDWMFKVALYGNTLDYNLLKRLKKSSNANIGSLIDGKIVFGGAGFHKGTKEKHHPFESILNKRIIENGEVNKFYSVSDNDENIITSSDIYLKSGREEKLYKGTQILVKEQAKNESEIVVSLTNQEYVIRSGIFSIASTSDKLLIKKIFSFMITSLYEYFIFMTSGSWGTSTRPQIRWKEEYLSFPIIDIKDEVKNKLALLINLFIESLENHYKDFKKLQASFYKDYNSYCKKNPPIKNEKVLSQINSIIFNQYKVKGYEKDLIDYTLNVSRYQFQESKQHLVSDFTYNDGAHYRNRGSVLKEYAGIYIEEFQEIYNDEYIQVEIYPLDHFIALNVVFSNEKPKEQITYPKNKKTEEEVLKRLANNLSISQITNTTDSSKNLFIQKDIKGFEENSFYIIKPNEYKCWHKAMAWYDVAEFKEAIETAELNSLNGSLYEF